MMFLGYQTSDAMAICEQLKRIDNLMVFFHNYTIEVKESMA